MQSANPALLSLVGVILFATSFVVTSRWLQDRQVVLVTDVTPIVAPTQLQAAAADSSIADELEEPLPMPRAEKTPQAGFQYIEVVDGCAHDFSGECLAVRSGPGTEYPSVAGLRNGMILPVAEIIETAERTWYKIEFTEWLRYPERLTDEWYVAADYVRLFRDEGEIVSYGVSTSTQKKIIIDISDQTLTALEGDEVFMVADASTGLDGSPTPMGNFTIFKKTPSRYMQGPLPGISDDYYDLPGVPWNLYFTEQGAVIHGAYWHESFGSQYSHGCANLSPAEAEKLYTWAEVEMPVIVQW